MNPTTFVPRRRQSLDFKLTGVIKEVVETNDRGETITIVDSYDGSWEVIFNAEAEMIWARKYLGVITCGHCGSVRFTWDDEKRDDVCADCGASLADSITTNPGVSSVETEK